MVEDVVKCLKANHANTAPLCACLDICCEQMPYREAEALIDALPVMDMSMQNAHTLIALLVTAGGIEIEEIGEEPTDEDSAEGEKEEEGETQRKDQPMDYLVCTTEGGHAALQRFDPVKRFTDLLAQEPTDYSYAYKMVLERCADGAKLSEVVSALQGISALSEQKPIYPEYFISKLETVGGLVWNGSWNTTEEGRRILALVG